MASILLARRLRLINDTPEPSLLFNASEGTRNKHSDARTKLFSGFGRAGPDFFGPRADRAFDENYFGRVNGP